MNDKNPPPESEKEPESVFKTTETKNVVEPDPSDPNSRQDDNYSQNSSNSKDEINSNEPTESEMDEAINKMDNNFIPPPEEMRPFILKLLESRRVEAVMASDYDKAEEQERLSNLMSKVIEYDQQKHSENSKVDVLYSRWKSLQNQKQEINNRWNQKIADFNRTCDSQLEKLEESQNKEIDDFIAKWKDPGFLRQFDKPSTRLLQIRDQERAMAVSRMYQKAKEMKAIGDELQKEETQAAQRKISKQMSLERKRLSQKHENEKDKLHTHRDITIQNMELERQKELRPIDTAISQIKLKKVTSNPPKTRTNTRSRSGPNTQNASRLPSLVQNSRNATSNSSRFQNNCSNTHAKYSRFKAEKRTIHLDITPIDDETMAKMKKPEAKMKSRPLTTKNARKQSKTDSSKDSQSEVDQKKEKTSTPNDIIQMASNCL